MLAKHGAVCSRPAAQGHTGRGGGEFRGTGLFLGEHLPWEAERLQAHSPLELASPRAASRAEPRGSLGSQL